MDDEHAHHDHDHDDDHGHEDEEAAEADVRRRLALAQIRQYGDPVLRMRAAGFESSTHYYLADDGSFIAEGATWKDIVRTTCYLRDIERDYETFNEERTAFYHEEGLDPLPASTGIQAILCRPELLIEIEAIAMFKKTNQE